MGPGSTLRVDSTLENNQKSSYKHISYLILYIRNSDSYVINWYSITFPGDAQTDYFALQRTPVNILSFILLFFRYFWMLLAFAGKLLHFSTKVLRCFRQTLRKQRILNLITSKSPMDLALRSKQPA